MKLFSRNCSDHPQRNIHGSWTGAEAEAFWISHGTRDKRGALSN